MAAGAIAEGMVVLSGHERPELAAFREVGHPDKVLKLSLCSRSMVKGSRKLVVFFFGTYPALVHL